MSRRHVLVPLLLGLSLVLAFPACTRHPAASVPPAGTAPAEPAEAPSTAAAQTSPEGTSVQILDYDISCEIDPPRHGLTATATVEWEAVEETPRLVFDLRPTLEIGSLKIGDGGDLAYERDTEGTVTVALPAPLAAGEKATMTIAYGGEINGPRGGSNSQRVWDYIGDEGTYVRFEAGWYPQIAGDSATADISITVPAGWSAVSTGELVSSEGNVFHWRTDIAAMGLSFAAAVYTLTDERAGDTPMLCYTFTEHAGRAGEFITECSGILALYEQLYGPYPFPKFAIAEIPDLYGGGHGDQSFIMLQEKSFRDPFDGEFVAHEMAHNWWGCLLMCTESEFMQEGFATYSQALYLEHSGGKAALRKAMKSQAEAVLISSTDPGTEKSCFASDSGPLLYEKGAWILHMLRGLLGDERWFAAVKAFATGNAGSVVTCAQLQDAFAAAYGEPLDWFFDQWLYGKGVPWVRAQVLSSRPGTAKVRLSQHLVLGEGEAEAGETWQTEPCSFRLPVDLAINHAGGTVRETVWLTQPYEEFDVSVQGEVTALTIDPDGRLLCHSKGLVGELDEEMADLHKDLDREMQDLEKELERELRDIGRTR